MTALARIHRSGSDDSELHDVSSHATPDVSLVLESLQDSVSEAGDWLTTAQDGERGYLCQWDGQSEDGRKWDKVAGKPVFPWDGSWDTRVRTIQASVDELVMLQLTAFFGSQPQAMQQEAGDAAAAGRVQTLLKYEINQRMRRSLWQEMCFAATWMTGYGHSIVRVGWQDRTATTLEHLTVEKLQDQLMQQQMPEGQVLPEQALAQMADMLMAGPDPLAEMILRIYPTLTPKRAKRAAVMLARTGQAEFRLPVKRPGRPMVRAYCPGVDIFYSWWLDDISRAPHVHCIETLTEVELRQKPLTEGWEQDFVDALLALGPVPAVESGAVARLGKMHTEAFHRFGDGVSGHQVRKRLSELSDCFQVVRSFVKTVDEDGFECQHEVVTHPSVSAGPDGLIGLNRVVDYFMEDGCFVQFRREWNSRANWESRGVMEIATPSQEALKHMRDSLLNRADLATSPPVRSYVKAHGKAVRLGIQPGHHVQDGPGGQRTEYMLPPRFDEGAVESLQYIERELSNVLGLHNDQVNLAKQQMHRQFLVDNFLLHCRDVVIKILAVDQQFMEPVYVSRVIGGGQQAFLVTREEIAGQFDVALSFNAMMMDLDYVKARWGVIKEAYANDKSGVMNDEVITRWLLSTMDANLADMAIGDAKEVSTDEYEHEQEQLALAATKQVIPPRNVKNPQSRLQAIQDTIQKNPTLSQLYSTDPEYQAIVDSRMQKYQFDLQQQQNAQIGREGYQAPELDAPVPAADTAPVAAPEAPAQIL